MAARAHLRTQPSLDHSASTVPRPCLCSGEVGVGLYHQKQPEDTKHSMEVFVVSDIGSYAYETAYELEQDHMSLAKARRMHWMADD
ncbi:hypothetical protein TREES_T100012938 [Tupaia chinensis]|uniref:Uncharacterized protein n=1 Tax=Tupaia chinensis TaxID=246437 RepID=L9L7K6_TUPCH|nr:hypothetical protein TREES_T100012938 [Tupaia chinensis]